MTGRYYEPFTYLRMETTARIRKLNDAFRTSLHGNGDFYLTRGVAHLPSPEVSEIIRRVRSFDAFTPENDPYYEHDFGSFEHNGNTIFWKIDCYDQRLKYASPDPANENMTVRILTVMLASEY